jgi:predicted PurR-regulated permease PerM
MPTEGGRSTKRGEKMRKQMLWSGSAAVVSVLLVTVIAYVHSNAVSAAYDERMHRDIQGFGQQLAQTGLPQAQIQTLQSILNDINHHTLSYVSSEADAIIGAIGFIGIIVISLILAFVGKLTKRTTESGHS